MIEVPPFFADYQRRVESELRRLVPEGGDRVQQSMAYTLHAPAKRVRAVLTLLSAELLGGTVPAALVVATALEMVHAASLILDDLPPMDNGPLRRGRPANHIVFGEDVAILGAFGLLNRAFHAMTHGHEPEIAAALIQHVTAAVAELIDGQAADLGATDQQVTFNGLMRIHQGKTGALFIAAATAGGITAGGTADDVFLLQRFAKNLGLAFQIIDDLLDVEGDPAVTGKPVRSDLKKTTFVSFSGAGGARQLAAELCHTADDALAGFGRRADRLRELSSFVAARMG